MSGICGFVSRREIGEEAFNKMINPASQDIGGAIFSANGYNIGLSGPDNQPLRSYDDSVSIVCYGAIYNSEGLKKQLDYPFTSKSSAEVIPAAYLNWGIDCLSRLNGAFAFALYDHRDNMLYLARDRIGEKPLYYWLRDGNIIFASELKPIMACPGFPKELRKEVLPRYLHQLCINAPDTIFQNVWKLEPGHFLRFKNGQAEDKVWWDLVDIYHQIQKNHVNDYDEAKAVLKEKLLGAISLRSNYGERPGTFLSGGYDSSLVTALAQSVSDRSVKTFCIGFHEEEKDEAPFAKAVAKHLGTDHTELYISEEDMLSLVDSIPEYYDEPFADSSQIPTMLVSKLARRDVTSALTGDAGDEFFCGYNHYDIMTPAQWLDMPGAVINALGKPLLNKLPFMVQVIAKNRDKETKTQFGGFPYIEAGRRMLVAGLPALYPVESSLREPDWQRRRMLLDLTHYLPGDGICKVERATARYSLNAMSPFLDVDVMEYSFSLRHDFKYKRGMKKRILKDLAYEYIPIEMLERRKTGFGVPLEKWLNGPLKERLVACSRADVLRHQGVFNPEETQRFVDEFLTTGDANFWSGRFYRGYIWSFLMFQMWYERYMG